MAVLRCPHCGKPNPDFLDLCQYCEKPLQAASASSRESEGPDWLRGLQDDSADVPDWLKKATGDLPAQPPPAEPADDVPDWLKSLGSAGQAAASPEDVPDWLKTSTGQLASEATSPLGPGTAPIADEPREAVPDWLKSLGVTGPTDAPTEQLETMPLPGTAPVRDTRAFTTAESAGETLPDWLKSLGATGSMPLPPSPPPAPAGEMPDWLQDIAPAEAAPAPPAAEPPSPPSSTGPEPIGADLPDWLQRATGPFTTEFAPPPPPVQPTEPQPVEEIPDWLQRVTGSLVAPSTSTEPVASDLPDWLQRATGSLAGKPAEPAPAAPVPTEPEGLPDWLKAATGPLTAAFTPVAFTPKEPPPKPPVTPEVPGLEKGELPDWLKPMTGKLPSAVPEVEAPAWPPPVAEAVPPVISEAPPAGVTTPSVLESEPDWLASLREEPEPVAGPEAVAAPTPPADLAQAELPSWLAAMRPVDVAPTGLDRETDDYLESVGVLGGLRGVLRAEPSVVLPGKSAANIHLLNYTDAQSRQAALLTRLVTVEAPAPAAKTRRAFSAWPWERWLVAGLLILSLVLTLPFGRDAAGQEISGPFAGLFPLPRTAAVEVVRAFETVASLDSARPVLVAFDYEPGQAGEMTPLADVVVGHLIRRGLPIVAVSTQVTGAGVAEDELARLTGAARGRINDYVRGVHYLNLGYLPGGPLGIRQLVGAPRSLARMGLPASGNLWETTPLLNSVQSFNDFSAVIVLSHTPDGARAWVEQTHGTTPRLVLVTSAGAAPLVRPYFEGNEARIAGFLGGPAAAMQYDTLGGSVFAVEQERAGWSRRWDMLGVGLLTVAGVLVFGNLIHGVRRGLAQTRRGKAR